MLPALDSRLRVKTGKAVEDESSTWKHMLFKAQHIVQTTGLSLVTEAPMLLSEPGPQHGQ